jgi:autotransporter translocation and assembly factor TamB
MPRNAWFRRRVSPKADIELSGRVRIRQEPGEEMRFYGRVEPMPNRGFLDVYGRNFRPTGGSIALRGPVDSMRFDLTAEYQVPTQSGPDAGILVNVAAKGRPDSLSLDFTADPTMDRDDIIAYIVTGRPASENPLAGTSSGSPQEAGAELVFSGLSDRLAGSASQALGLDVFQIKQDGLRGLMLNAGRYIAPRVFLSLQQPIQLSSDAQQTPGAGLGPGFRLEYSVRPWLRADLRGGSLPPRFLFRGHHAY